MATSRTTVLIQGESGTGKELIAHAVHAFFFQAEDGIRVHCVTGVQTCALPISSCRQCLYRARQLALRASAWGLVPAASRRYRPRTLDGRLRRRDRGGSALARPLMG